MFGNDVQTCQNEHYPVEADDEGNAPCLPFHGLSIGIFSENLPCGNACYFNKKGDDGGKYTCDNESAVFALLVGKKKDGCIREKKEWVGDGLGEGIE